MEQHDHINLDEDLAQNRGRLIFLILGLSYLLLVHKFWMPLSDAALGFVLASITVYGLYAVAMIYAIPSPRIPVMPRRILSLLVDFGGLSIVMQTLDQYGTPFYPLLLWIIVGNGMRFGSRYLTAALAIGLTAFSTVIFLTPYWRENLPVALGLLFGTLILPLFYFTLINRLHKLNHKVDTERALLRSLIDSIPDLIFFKDKNGVYLGCNKAFEGYTGRAEADQIGRTDFDFFDQETAESYRLNDRLMLDSGNARSNEESITYPDGRKSLLETLKTPYASTGGEVLGLIGISRDITQRKQAEDELRAAHEEVRQERALLAQRVEERTMELLAANTELSQTARAKDEFMATMSHELRTPLTAVLGMSEALMDGTLGKLNEEQEKYLKIIHESGLHLLELINDILDVTKADAGKLQLDVAPLQVDELCEASVRLVKAHAQDKEQKLEVNIDPAVKHIQGDQKRLKQILVNLLGNAVKFTPKGGSIGLDVKANAAAGQLVFEVWDTGIGISAEDQKKLFQPFVQVDSKLSRQYGGTGLGLVMVERLAKLHHGEVSLESSPGQGSRFRVTLPWQEKAEISVASQEIDAPRPVRHAAPLTAKRALQLILLAEDNPVNIKLLENFLKISGYQVEIARDGLEALSKAAALRPNLILMDVQMPNMDGLEATRRIKADPGLAHIPVVAMTALAMVGDRERCIAAGMDDYISKPISLNQVMALIESFLGAQDSERTSAATGSGT